MDEEILKTVESMLGKDVKIVDCEKTSSVRQEEVLLINGIPVTLEGPDGDAIKSALMTGQVPSCELLNQLLYQAGILRQPIQLETSLSVKSTMVTKEEVSVERDGRILDERTSETKEDNFYTSSSREIWEPVVSTKTKKTLADRKDVPSSNTKFSAIPALSVKKTDSMPTDIYSSYGSWDERDRKSVSVSPTSSSNTLMTATTTTTATSTADECSRSAFDDDDDDDNDDGDDDDDEEDENEGSLYTISSNMASASTFSNYPSSNLIYPFNNGLSFTSSPPAEDDVDDERCSLLANSDNSKCQKKSNENSISGDNNKQCLTNDLINNCLSEKNFKQKYGKNSSISCDSGHDDIFNSPSQTNFLLQTTNTDNSISSCYDFISSDEAECVISHSKNVNKISLNDWGRENGDPAFTADKFRPTTAFGKSAALVQKGRSHQKVLPQTNPVTVNAKHSYVKSTSAGTANDVANKSSSSSLSTASINSKQQQHRYHDLPQSSEVDTENDELSLVYRDCNLISGSLDALIQHMVPTCDYYPENSFVFAFLLSARLFIRPHELLSRICDIWEKQQSEYDSIDECDDAKTVPYNLPTVKTSSSKSVTPSNPTITRKSHQNAQNFIVLLAEWIDTFPYDFRDERLMQHVRLVTKKCTVIDVNNLGKIASKILQNLVQRLTILERYEEFLQSIAVYPQENFKNDLTSGLAAERTASSTSHPISTCGSSSDNAGTSTHHHREHHRTDSHDSGGLSAFYKLSSSTSCHQSSDNSTNNSLSSFNSDFDIGELCPNPALLAHQLTHIELERLSHIGPEEFVQAFAKENPHLESFSDMKKTRNLEAYVQWFNRLSYFVATEIVKHSKKKIRVRVVEYWIETARGCFNIGNFNSLMAIIAGLNMSPISRLKKTWSKVPSDKFSVLEHQMDPTSNFNSYRSTLKAAMWRSAGATDERERIIIPFFSLLVKDLYFLNEGCSNRLPNGHINFEKFWQLAKQVQDFNTWKKVTCPFEKQQKIIMFLQTSPVLNESTLSMASFECEPPENTQEKDRYKTLKSENKHHLQQLLQ